MDVTKEGIERIKDGRAKEDIKHAAEVTKEKAIIAGQYTKEGAVKSYEFMKRNSLKFVGWMKVKLDEAKKQQAQAMGKELPEAPDAETTGSDAPAIPNDSTGELIGTTEVAPPPTSDTPAIASAPPAPTANMEDDDDLVP